MTEFVIYDVFTEVPFGGNPLAVVPDATGLPETLLQTIAREFNLSETTFVFPPTDPAHSARVRIFTPVAEVPFAGHPTIGTAVALADRGLGPRMVLELGVGPIETEAADGRARFTTTRHLSRAGRPATAAVAACLGLDSDQIRLDGHGPQQAGLGLDFVLVELVSAGALAGARPVTEAFRSASAAWPTALGFAIYAYVRDGADIRARMFAPLNGVPEDPATGSAAAALAAVLAEQDGTIALRVAQGVEMGRPSRIDTEVRLVDGRAAAVTVSGAAVKVAEGRLTLS